MSRLTTADIVRINREAETQHVDDHRVVLIGGLEVTVHVAATGHLTIAGTLPTPVLADVLGLSTTTAERWARSGTRGTPGGQISGSDDSSPDRSAPRPRPCTASWPATTYADSPGSTDPPRR